MSAPVLDNGLTLRREHFCQAFVVNGGNGSDAYRKAFSAENMSAPAIRVEASRLLDVPNVSLRIRELQAEALAAAGVTPAAVVSRLMRNADEAISKPHVPQYSSRTDGRHPLGVVGMRERVVSLGGSFEIGRAGDSGTFVRCRFPITQARVEPIVSEPEHA